MYSFTRERARVSKCQSTPQNQQHITRSLFLTLTGFLSYLSHDACLKAETCDGSESISTVQKSVLPGFGELRAKILGNERKGTAGESTIKS